MATATFAPSLRPCIPATVDISLACGGGGDSISTEMFEYVTNDFPIFVSDYHYLEEANDALTGVTKEGEAVRIVGPDHDGGQLPQPNDNGIYADEGHVLEHGLFWD